MNNNALPVDGLTCGPCNHRVRQRPRDAAGVCRLDWGKRVSEDTPACAQFYGGIAKPQLPNPAPPPPPPGPVQIVVRKARLHWTPDGHIVTEPLAAETVRYENGQRVPLDRAESTA
jgi:hypothetical protein